MSQNLVLALILALSLPTFYFAIASQFNYGHLESGDKTICERENIMKSISGNGVVVVMSTKSVGISIILTLLFGPIGMFYSTIAGGIIMLIVSLIVGVATIGFGLIVTWPICVIWGAIAASSYNRELMKML